jgi:hypothetical protein
MLTWLKVNLCSRKPHNLGINKKTENTSSGSEMIVEFFRKRLRKMEKRKRRKNKIKQNTTNFIFINRSGMDEVSTILYLDLFFTFTTTKNDGSVTEYNFI